MTKNIEYYLDLPGEVTSAIVLRTGEVITGAISGTVYGAYLGLKGAVLFTHFAPTRIRRLMEKESSSDKDNSLDMDLDQKIMSYSFAGMGILSYLTALSCTFGELMKYYTNQQIIQEDALGLAAIPIITNLCSGIYEYVRSKK